jgi:3-oxoacyl-[acyl-carrier-protein] synthase I
MDGRLQQRHPPGDPAALKRVVVTGYGLVSCLGNDAASVTEALRSGRSGLRFVEEYRQLGMRSCVAGVPDLDREAPIDRKLRRFMGDAAVYAYYAMSKAVEHARLDAADIASERTGLIVGTGAGSPYELSEAIDVLRARGTEKVVPYKVPRIMGSTASANLSTAFGIRGLSYALNSACASSAHSIGHGGELIRMGKQDVMFCGGAEEVRWTSSAMFDAMGVLSTAFNDPSASRPFDADRDGFVIAGGGGIVVLEELEHARSRGAAIHAELVGYGATSDGMDMVNPDPEGGARAMRLALAEARNLGFGEDVAYLNAHATSTPAGDMVELESIRRVFGERPPRISSTKGQTGHPIAAAGVHEAIYCLLMMRESFIAPCINLEELDPLANGFPLVRSLEGTAIDSFMSNSFGFGGSNASLIFRRSIH